MTGLLETVEPGEDGLVVQRSRHWGYNALGVVSAGEAVAVDPGLTPDELSAFRAELERGGRRVVAVVLTHSHHDHIRGWRAFGDARVIAPRVVADKPEDARTRIIAAKRKFDQRGGIEDDGFTYPTVDETFDERGGVRVGALELELEFLPGHSNCTSVVVVPALRAILTADYLVRPGLPYCRWEALPFEAAHERLLELCEEHGLERALPAHNALIEGRAQIESAVRTELDYFRDLRAEIERRVTAGENADRLVRDVTHWLTERRGEDLGLVARQDADNARRVLAETAR
ncbi:MAG: MBL fold metallo-hydrolase [Planctomycetota bacterium]